jgi:DNA invertase Pin-like site-specific DNA recombinase
MGVAKKKSNPALVVIYTRVSTDSDRQELGQEAQIQDCLRWCAAHGKTVVGTFQEEMSGGALFEDRRVLQQALACIEDQQAGVLLAQKIDRFSRDLHESMKIVQALRRLGATLVAVQTGGMEDPISELLFNVLTSVAQYERFSIQERIRKAFAVKRSRQEYLGGRVPYGFVVVEQAGKKMLLPHEEEQKKLKRLRELRGQGYSWAKVSEVAVLEGIRWRSGSPMDPKWLRKNLETQSTPPVPPPYGFSWDESRTELILNQDEQAILQWLLLCHEKKIHYAQMARQLNMQGVLTRSRTTISSRWVRERIEEIRRSSCEELTEEPRQDQGVE